MGYYIDFIFDENINLSSDIIVYKFLKAGAEKIPLEDQVKSDKFIVLLHPDFISPIDVFTNESKSQKGNWAHIRLSWGTDIDKFKKTLRDLIDLSNKVDCQLFDGQADIFITEDNIEIFIAEFQKTSANIIGLKGQIKRDIE